MVSPNRTGLVNFSSWPRNPHGQHGGDQARAEYAVGDAPAEGGLAGLGLIHVGRIQIPGDAREQVDVGLGDGFAHGVGIADSHLMAAMPVCHQGAQPMFNNFLTWSETVINYVK